MCPPPPWAQPQIADEARRQTRLLDTVYQHHHLSEPPAFPPPTGHAQAGDSRRAYHRDDRSRQKLIPYHEEHWSTFGVRAGGLAFEKCGRLHVTNQDVRKRTLTGAMFMAVEMASWQKKSAPHHPIGIAKKQHSRISPSGMAYLACLSFVIVDGVNQWWLQTSSPFP